MTAKDIRIALRDRQALSGMILQPMVVILVLGLALGPMFRDTGPGPASDVGVVDSDGGVYSQVFFKEVLEGEGLSEFLTQVPMTEDEARALIKAGKLRAAVVIPAGFSEKIMAGQPTAIRVLSDPASGVFAPMVRSIASSYAQTVAAQRVSMETVVRTWLVKGTASPVQLGSLYAEAAPAVAAAIRSPGPVLDERTAAAQKLVSSFQYYAAGMGVMFLLFGTMMGARSLLDERDQFTLARILATPTPRSIILAGKVVTVFVIGALQWTTLVLFTRIAYGVRWGTSPEAMAALSAATVFAAAGVGILLSTAARTRRGVGLASALFIQVSSLLGGSMVPIMVFPEFIKPLSKITLNWWAMTGFTALFTGSGLTDVVPSVAALLAIGAIAFIIGVARLRLD
jgi:ABC-2 type transport system permease protein